MLINSLKIGFVCAWLIIPAGCVPTLGGQEWIGTQQIGMNKSEFRVLLNGDGTGRYAYGGTKVTWIERDDGRMDITVWGDGYSFLYRGYRTTDTRMEGNIISSQYPLDIAGTWWAELR